MSCSPNLWVVGAVDGANAVVLDMEEVAAALTALAFYPEAAVKDGRVAASTAGASLEVDAEKDAVLVLGGVLVLG